MRGLTEVGAEEELRASLEKEGKGIILELEKEDV